MLIDVAQDGDAVILHLELVGVFRGEGLLGLKASLQVLLEGSGVAQDQRQLRILLGLFGVGFSVGGQLLGGECQARVGRVHLHRVHRERVQVLRGE
jgi:hypothetical protein